MEREEGRGQPGSLVVCGHEEEGWVQPESHAQTPIENKGRSKSYPRPQTREVARKYYFLCQKIRAGPKRDTSISVLISLERTNVNYLQVK